MKEKRSVLNRMKDRVKNSYNVSIAEIDHQDLWQRTSFALVAVSFSKEVAEREVKRAIRLLESNPDWEMTACTIDYL